MDLDAAVVFDEAELAKSIHEEADAGPGGADHLCKSFLCDSRNQALRLTRLTKFGINRRILAKRFSLELKS